MPGGWLSDLPKIKSRIHNMSYKCLPDLGPHVPPLCHLPLTFHPLSEDQLVSLNHDSLLPTTGLLHMPCLQLESLLPLLFPRSPPTYPSELSSNVTSSEMPSLIFQTRFPLVQSHIPLLCLHFLIVYLFESLVSCLLYQSISFKRVRTTSL